MGMSTFVYGIKPSDEKWKKMKAVRDACNAAGLAIPEEVNTFFGWDEPDDKGVRVDLRKFDCCQFHTGEGKENYEIDVKKLPPDVTIIRFVNAW